MPLGTRARARDGGRGPHGSSEAVGARRVPDADEVRAGDGVLVALVRAATGRAALGERAGPPPGSRPAPAPPARTPDDDGRATALEVLVRHLYPTCARCLRVRLPDVPPDTFADLLQEAAMRVAERVDRCAATTDQQVRAWACVVAIRAGLGFLRSPASGSAEQRGAVSPDAAPQHALAWPDASAEADPEVLGALTVLSRVAADAQADLPDEAVALLWYKVVEDASWAEAGARLGTTAPGAKRRYQRAQAALRRLLHLRVLALDEPARSLALARLRTLDGPEEEA